MHLCAADTIREAVHNARPLVQRADNPVPDAHVVTSQVELGLAARREVDPVRAGDTNGVATNVQLNPWVLASARRHDPQPSATVTPRSWLERRTRADPRPLHLPRRRSPRTGGQGDDLLAFQPAREPPRSPHGASCRLARDDERMPLVGFHIQRAVGTHVRSDDVRSVETGGGEKPSFIVFDVIDDSGIDGPACVDIEARLPARCRPIVAEPDERPCLTYADLHHEAAGKAIDIHRYMVTEGTSRRAQIAAERAAPAHARRQSTCHT